MRQSQQTRPIIIFDFDGTLVDTFTLALTVLAQLAHRPVASQEDISRLRGLSSMELRRELGIRMWQVPLLSRRIRRELSMQLAQIAAVPGIEDVLHRLSQRYHLFILSSNSATNVRTVLERLGVAGCFVGIYGDAGIMRKKRSLIRLLRQNQLQAKDVWYVCDEARDISAAHSVGMPVVAVSWGFNNIAALERHHPDKLVFTPEELADFFAVQLTVQKSHET